MRFDPFKRIQPRRTVVGQNTAGAVPDLTPDFSDTSVIEAFAPLVGAAAKVFNREMQNNEQDIEKKVAENLEAHQENLAGLHKKFKEAEARGEVPKGYSPALWAATRTALGQEIGSKVRLHLDTVTTEQLKLNPLTSIDPDAMYANAVNQVLGENLGDGVTLETMDTDFLMGYRAMEDQFADQWQSEAYKIKGEGRIQEAKETFASTLSAAVKDGIHETRSLRYLDQSPDAEPQEVLTDSLQKRYKELKADPAMRDVFGPGEMDEVFMRVLNDEVDTLVGLANAQEAGTGAGEAYANEAEVLLEAAKAVVTDPRPGKNSKTLGERYTVAANDMTVAVERALQKHESKEGDGRKFSEAKSWSTFVAKSAVAKLSNYGQDIDSVDRAAVVAEIRNHPEFKDMGLDDDMLLNSLADSEIKNYKDDELSREDAASNRAARSNALKSAQTLSVDISKAANMDAAYEILRDAEEKMAGMDEESASAYRSAISNQQAEIDNDTRLFDNVAKETTAWTEDFMANTSLKAHADAQFNLPPDSVALDESERFTENLRKFRIARWNSYKNNYLAQNMSPTSLKDFKTDADAKHHFRTGWEAIEASLVDDWMNDERYGGSKYRSTMQAASAEATFLAKYEEEHGDLKESLEAFLTLRSPSFSVRYSVTSYGGLRGLLINEGKAGREAYSAMFTLAERLDADTAATSGKKEWDSETAIKGGDGVAKVIKGIQMDPAINIDPTTGRLRSGPGAAFRQSDLDDLQLSLLSVASVSGMTHADRLQLKDGEFGWFISGAWFPAKEARAHSVLVLPVVDAAGNLDTSFLTQAETDLEVLKHKGWGEFKKTDTGKWYNLYVPASMVDGAKNKNAASFFVLQGKLADQVYGLDAVMTPQDPLQTAPTVPPR